MFCSFREWITHLWVTVKSHFHRELKTEFLSKRESRSVVPWQRRWTDKMRRVPQNGKQKHFIRSAYHHLLLISSLSSFLSLMALVHRSGWWCQAPANESFHHWRPLLKTNTFSCWRRRLWSWLPTAHYMTIIFVFESFKLKKKKS